MIAWGLCKRIQEHLIKSSPSPKHTHHKVFSTATINTLAFFVLLPKCLLLYLESHMFTSSMLTCLNPISLFFLSQNGRDISRSLFLCYSQNLPPFYDWNHMATTLCLVTPSGSKLNVISSHKLPWPLSTPSPEIFSHTFPFFSFFFF